MELVSRKISLKRIAMNSKLCLLLIATLTLGVMGSALSQGSKTPRKRIVIHDRITLERLVFSNLGLTPAQKRQTDRLLTNLASENAQLRGLGLAPTDPKLQAKKVAAIRFEFQSGLKKTLTPAQLQKYISINRQIAAKMQGRRQPGMHF
jgi:hypothetical protein